MNTDSIWQQLDQVLAARKAQSSDASYVASLYQKGSEAILKKIGEESAETIIAAKDIEQGANTDKLTYETTDLVFHLLILLHHNGLTSQDIEQELSRRFGLSGHEEKAQRTSP